MYILLKLLTLYWLLYAYLNCTKVHDSNQIYLVTFTNTQLTQATFLQKNQTLQNVFFDSCNAEMAQNLSSLQKSEFLKLIIMIFHVKKLNN
jgi:hypothetical protein